MRTRTYMTGILSLMVNAVLFGAGAIAVLSIPALDDMAKYLLPAVIVLSLAIAPVISWYMAPKLRLRHNRGRS